MRYFVDPDTGELNSLSSIPPATAEDQDKVLQGSGDWGHKLQFDVVIQNGSYGYINSNNEFVSFKSQADIDAAVSAAKVGTATAAEVLSGYTFTNSTDSGVEGAMTNNGAVSPSGLNCGGSYAIPAGYHNGSGVVTANSLASQTGVDSGKTAVGAGQMVSGYQGWVNGSKVTGTFTGQEKTVTAGTSAGSVTPDSGKYLTKVTYNPTPSQEKTITSSRSAQTVSPDSGKLLSKVTVNGLSPTGTYSTSTRGTAIDMGSTSNYRYVNTNSVTNTNSGTYTMGTASTGATYDMGATNTYRYVNAANVYNKGKAVSSLTLLKSNITTRAIATETYTITASDASTYKYILFLVSVTGCAYQSTVATCEVSGTANKLLTNKIDRTVQNAEYWGDQWTRTVGISGICYNLVSNQTITIKHGGHNSNYAIYGVK